LQIGNEYLIVLRFARKNLKLWLTKSTQRAIAKTLFSNIVQVPKIEVQKQELETAQHYIYLDQMI